MTGRGLWYRSGRFGLSSRLTHLNISRSPGIILGPGSSTLFIERVTEEDEGVYHCRATNQKGSVESSAYLTVQGKQLLQKAREAAQTLISLFVELSTSQWPAAPPVYSFP